MVYSDDKASRSRGSRPETPQPRPKSPRRPTPSPITDTSSSDNTNIQQPNLLEIRGLTSPPERGEPSTQGARRGQAMQGWQQEQDDAITPAPLGESSYSRQSQPPRQQSSLVTPDTEQANSGLVQKTPDVIQRLKGFTKFPFFKRGKSKPHSPTAAQKIISTTNPTTTNQTSINKFAIRQDGSYVVIKYTFPSFDLVMYDQNNQQVNSCSVSAAEVASYDTVYINTITSEVENSGLGALALYYLASKTQLANVGATTVIAGAAPFYEKMGMTQSQIDEYIGTRKVVKEKAFASLSGKWTLN